MAQTWDQSESFAGGAVVMRFNGTTNLVAVDIYYGDRPGVERSEYLGADLVAHRPLVRVTGTNSISRASVKAAVEAAIRSATPRWSRPFDVRQIMATSMAPTRAARQVDWVLREAQRGRWKTRITS